MKYPKAHPWTLKKLKFLEMYLPAFEKATQKALNRYYVDGFAGPGYNRRDDGERVRGSPLLAVQHRSFTKFFFVEADPQSYEALRNGLKGEQIAPEKIRLYQGDFNVLVDEILTQIPKKAPTVFFLDPFGLELKWSTVEKIAQREKADVFILISGSGINRARKTSPGLVTEFFGDESWSNISRKPGQTWFEAFTEAYRDRMRGLGLDGTELVTVATNSRRAPMHVLAFHAKNNIALRIANSVFRRIDTDPTQPRLFGR
ncbi:MAG: three-Cys-motif partner protein TcmP [Meiothermus sp.]|nr:three-Cys-motif partner protein TcmP [Meiothermus sp.]